MVGAVIRLELYQPEDKLLQLRSNSFKHGDAMPSRLAFARLDAPVTWSANLSPHLAWGDAPAETLSWALVCVDMDAPSKPDDVNKANCIIPAGLPRTEFTHWLMANIPLECRELSEGACSEGVLAHGKQKPYGPPGSLQGCNDYTHWFAGDPAMEGRYLGYDGPWPPWNDSILHRYHFYLYALDIAYLTLKTGFTLSELREAMVGHVVAKALLIGTYTLNQALVGN